DVGLHIWDVARGKCVGRLPASEYFLRYAHWSRDGRRLVTLNQANVLSLWEIPSGKKLAEVDGGEEAGWVLGCSPDGSRFAWGQGNTIHLWDCARGKEAGRLALPGEDVSAVAFERDGRGLIVFVDKGPAYFWDLATDRRHACLSNQELVWHHWGL